MTIIVTLKFIHYLAIVFSGGVLVGAGVIQSVHTSVNQIPDLTTAKILRLLGYIGLLSLIILWISGIILSIAATALYRCLGAVAPITVLTQYRFDKLNPSANSTGDKPNSTAS